MRIFNKGEALDYCHPAFQENGGGTGIEFNK